MVLISPHIDNVDNKTTPYTVPVDKIPLAQSAYYELYDIQTVFPIIKFIECNVIFWSGTQKVIA